MATEQREGARTDHLAGRLFRAPVAADSLHALRIGFGALMVLALVRFWALGWIDAIYLQPDFHFTYYGFSWVRPLSAPWIYVQFTAMIWSAGALACGFRPRLHAALFFVLFTWTELIEKAAYLNHYYLVSLLALILAAIPWTREARLAHTLPAWCLTLARGQVAAVYFFAGIAKVGSDWVVHAEPLATWLQAYAHIPVVGAWLTWAPTAHAMSVAGLVFDTTIVGFLLWPRTRAVAYAVAVVFHITVWLLFPIGMFSFVMLLAATVFFAPDWPAGMPWRERAREVRPPAAEPLKRPHQATIACVCVFLALQWTLPLRHLAYPGETNWTEQGFRFAWRVMLIEKTGTLTYRVQCDPADRARLHSPAEDLSELQLRMVRTQPDMILEYAHYLADRERSASCPRPMVFADSFVSLNGRRAQRMIDETANLSEINRSLISSEWILGLDETTEH